MLPSKKARFIASCLAALSFVGTLAVFARADDSEGPPTRKYIVVATNDGCVDYHQGQRIILPADTPNKLTIVDLGEGSEEIAVAPAPPEEQAQQ